MLHHFFKPGLLALLFSVTLFSCESVNHSKPQTYNIVDFGAKPDTSVLNTKAIQTAIDLCNKNGGGEVVVPIGVYKTGTIVLKDNVTLYLAKGAKLLGSGKLADYFLLDSITTNNFTHPWRGLVAAYKAKNIKIYGEGEINGNGLAPEFACYPIPNHPQNHWHKPPRPSMVFLWACEDVDIDGIKLREGATWGMRLYECKDVYLHNLDMYNHVNANNDGIDIDACSDVRVSDCVIDSDDDGLCLKSLSKTPTQRVTVTNCIISSKCNAFKIGNESHGGFFDITVSNCIIRRSIEKNEYDPNRGYNFTGGIGVVAQNGANCERVLFSNITIEKYATPIYVVNKVDMRDAVKGIEVKDTAQVKHVKFNNITILGDPNTTCLILGYPNKPVKHIELSNITFQQRGGLDSIPTLITENPVNNYPFGGAFKQKQLPSACFFIMDAEDVMVSNLYLDSELPENREKVVGVRAKNLTIK